MKPALIMPRQRQDLRQNGKRLGSFTVYVVAPLERSGRSDRTAKLLRTGSVKVDLGLTLRISEVSPWLD